jgi:hypothetical protein
MPLRITLRCTYKKTIYVYVYRRCIYFYCLYFKCVELTARYFLPSILDKAVTRLSASINIKPVVSETKSSSVHVHNSPKV